MAGPVISVESLSKEYVIGGRKGGYQTLREVIMHKLARPFGNGENAEPKKFWALKDVSFEVEQGEIIGIIGRNGAGKSTLLKILSRITEPTQGRITLKGRVASLLEVGTGFHPELTGRENIYLNGSILGMKKLEIDKKFDEIVSFAEIEKFIDTPVKHYSSGMYVRLAFAVAAHLEPEILLVDEVLAVGDFEFQKKCLGRMQAIANQGRTVFFVSHNMLAINRLCSRVLLLREGQKQCDGSAQEVLKQYMHDKSVQLAERNWQDLSLAPGDSTVRILSVRVTDQEGNIRRSFNLREPIYLEIDYAVLQEGRKLDAGFYLYDESGQQIFNAGDFQSNKEPAPRLVGRHTTRCRIPGNFLNEYLISVTAYVSEHPYVCHALAENVISFNMIDDMKTGGARGSFTRPWPGGVVRPLLEWDFKFEELQKDQV